MMILYCVTDVQHKLSFLCLDFTVNSISKELYGLFLLY